MALTLLCADDCGAASSDVPSNYHDPCASETRDFGVNQFGLIKCDYEFTDITDTAEWTAAVGTSDIGLMPQGITTFNAPSQNTFPVESCGRELPEEAEIDIDFATYWVDSTLLDFDYWSTIFSGFTGWNLFWIDCNGIWFFTDNWVDAINNDPAPVTVADESPGFAFSITQTPIAVEGEGGLWQWQMQFRIKSNTVIKGTFLPGVIAAIS